MATTDFTKIPSTITLVREVEKPPDVSVVEELKSRKEQLEELTAVCKTIKRAFKQPKKPPLNYAYRYICYCPQFKPKYSCDHCGNVILDRDVLTKEEHICFLATPKKNFGQPRKMPRFYTKRLVRPKCTTRIESLSKPPAKRVAENMKTFREVLTKKAMLALRYQLENAKKKPYLNLNTALEYMEEEKRLLKVRKAREKRRCRQIKRCILRKQRKQIRQIICILFEEMKGFLLNDEFVVDDRSSLCAVILEQIREFTDKEFYTTSNLREYQYILANNLTVWINKFISNLNIHITQPEPKVVDRPQTLDTFLPVEDYISISDHGEDELDTEPDFVPIDETAEGGEGGEGIEPRTSQLIPI